MNGNVPIRADCHWPEQSVDHLAALLSDWSKHDDYFTSVVSVDIRREEGGRTLMTQVHQASGISNREVTLWGASEKKGDVRRFTWTMDGAPQTESPQGYVQVGHDTGYWELEPHPEGGARVVYHLVYDPAGMVPGFVVRSFQTGGIVELVGELREAAKGG